MEGFDNLTPVNEELHKKQRPRKRRSQWSSDSSTETSANENNIYNYIDGDAWKSHYFVEKNTFREMEATMEGGKGMVVGIRTKKCLPENANIYFEIKSGSHLSAEGPNPLELTQARIIQVQLLTCPRDSNLVRPSHCSYWV